VEYGIVLSQHVAQLRRRLHALLEEDRNELTMSTRHLFHSLYVELAELEAKITSADQRIERAFQENAECQRIAAVEGIVPVTATAVVAAGPVGRPPTIYYIFTKWRRLYILNRLGAPMQMHLLARLSYCFVIGFFFSCCAGCGSGSGAPVTISTQPADRAVIAGQTATFSVAATNAGSLKYQWRKGNTPIRGATAASYTTGATRDSDSGSQFSVEVSNSAGVATSDAATLTVNPATDVLTHHNDNARTGQNFTETILTPSNVNFSTFGKIGFYPVDGPVDAEPLYASNVVVPNNGTHNILVAATEHGTVYTFDADSGATIWQVSTLKMGENPSDDPSCPTSCAVLNAEIGVNPTPVIDRVRGTNGTIYLVAASKDGTGSYHQRLHALDLALGTELFGGPVEIQATYPGTGDNSDGTNVIFDPKYYRERCALLLLNGVIYTTWASHYDMRPYTGWIIGYDASTLAQTSVLNVTPNGGMGAIWMSGAGPAADTSGNIYFANANGDFDETLDANGYPSNGDYGNAFMKVSTANGLSVADYFEMDNELQENVADVDFGSGGTMVLPDQSDGLGHTMHLAVGAGKDTNLYVVNRDSMGKFNANNNNIYQELTGVLPGGVYAAPAYFNNTIYYGSWGGPIQAFTITTAKLPASASAQTAHNFGYPGAAPSISANGTNDGIVWAVENSPTIGVLYAHDAASLKELYDSNQASEGRDHINANKFITPMIANGRVFVGTPNGVAVFGLLPR